MSNRFLVIVLLLQIAFVTCGVNIQCAFGDTWPGLTFLEDNAKFQTLSSIIENETVTTINGQAANFYHSENVKMLDIDDQTVRYFPKGLEKIFPNLEGISIYNSKLKKISKSDLKPFPALRELCLHNNELETLDSDLFEFNPELRLIYLNSNKLKQIGANIFDSLTKLENVYLQ